MVTPGTSTPPSPLHIFETLNAYQQTAALKAGIELDIFTAIAEGADSPATLAKRCQAAERGVRILCDYLVVIEFLTKHDQRYALTPESAMFLDRRSPACVASAIGFLSKPELVDTFKDLATAVRKGGSVMEGEGTVSPDNPLWVDFARSMAPIQVRIAEAVAQLLNASAGEKWKVLDIAAGHGMYGVTIARHNPNAEIYAVDWSRVLEVAAENARQVGVASRHHLLPGSALEVPFGTGYDIILLTGFLHHWDPPTIEVVLRKVHAALRPGGRAVTVEFIPNEDRVTPPAAAAFSLIMLASTRAGDAYTFSEYERMFRQAGFASSEHCRLTPNPQSVIISRK